MNFPRVGVGVLILNRQGEILLGKRKGSHGSGDWSPAGGHLEFNESFEDCAIREVFEETGLKLKRVKFLAVTNDFYSKENKHYVTIFMGVKLLEEVVPELKEPNKIKEWRWFEREKLPQNLFISFENFIRENQQLLMHL